MKVTRVGVNEDGTPRYHYLSDGHVVFTGPIKGTVTTADGTEYDVADDYVEVPHVEHAEEVAHLIAMRYVAEGHPTDPTFTYEPPAKFADRPRGKKG